MIDNKALPNGNVEISIDGKTETLQSAIVSAFISQILAGMSQQAEMSGDITPEGGAILYPTGAGVVFHKESGEPRLQIMFGKAMFVIAMPAGEMKKVAATINQMVEGKFA
ncbi:hypothetical protein HNQ68_002288 [Pseudochrobactrum saccharolyticum]|uniref:Uncharacterized protein n=1 Tax=Pseudochrobactrum saccharolyticum TaxID=354352 RepID=A0A7W8AJX4_9HYPH|nr:hypothetical protein [Pseudochrobactrum saccharolyticum]KAB0538465.1 hypothetical protein F7P81_12285 [Pseudochrobactrum saccharolyticum]MBB5091747.1 hypothetical protein [Pseudochrobactrum saccharolyticum]